MAEISNGSDEPLVPDDYGGILGEQHSKAIGRMDKGQGCVWSPLSDNLLHRLFVVLPAYADIHQSRPLADATMETLGR